jgi:hypothetical protein
MLFSPRAQCSTGGLGHSPIQFFNSAMLKQCPAQEGKESILLYSGQLIEGSYRLDYFFVQLGHGKTNGLAMGFHIFTVPMCCNRGTWKLARNIGL